MSTVYVLELPTGYYVGVTEDIARRLHQHRTGYCKTTRKMGATESCKLLHSWEVPGRLWAERFELWLHRNAVRPGAKSPTNLSLLFELILDVPIWKDRIFKPLVADCVPPSHCVSNHL